MKFLIFFQIAFVPSLLSAAGRFCDGCKDIGKIEQRISISTDAAVEHVHADIKCAARPVQLELRCSTCRLSKVISSVLVTFKTTPRSYLSPNQRSSNPQLCMVGLKDAITFAKLTKRLESEMIRLSREDVELNQKKQLLDQCRKMITETNSIGLTNIDPSKMYWPRPQPSGSTNQQLAAWCVGGVIVGGVLALSLGSSSWARTAKN